MLYEVITVSNIFGLYIDALAQKNTEQANEYLNSISKYQYKYGAEILPSAFKRDLEIWYNKSALFMTLSPYFLLLGILLLIFNLIRLVKPQRQFKWILRIGLTLVILAFFCYTLGLGIRWYISGHAPWSVITSYSIHYTKLYEQTISCYDIHSP